MNFTKPISILSDRIKSLKSEITRLNEYECEMQSEYIFVTNDIQNMESEIINIQKAIEILLKNEK